MGALFEQIRLDFRSDVPLYLQIARQIEHLVTTGALQVGDQLPTVRELATGRRINFNTVARAYHVLDDARLISTQRGRGTYIWEEPSPETDRMMRQKTLEELAAHYLREASKLGVDENEAVEALQAVLRLGSSEPKPEDAEEMNL